MSSNQFNRIARFKRALILLLPMLVSFCDVQAATAVKVRPAWRIEGAPSRIALYRGSESFILTEVPANITNKFVSSVAACSAEKELKSGIIFNDGNKLTVLIDASAVANRGRVDLYMIAGEKPAVPSKTLLREPAPLHGTVGRTAGMDYPRTRAEADSLTTRFDRALKTFAVTGFDQLGGTYEDWFRGDWRRKSHLVDLQSWILVPKDGKYIFGVAGTAPAWLDVGEKQLVEHPAYQPFDKWTAGDPLPLKAGIHRVMVRTLCRKKIDTGVAWKREGEEGTADDVVMITGVDMSKGRQEWPGRTVHPFFSYITGKTYRFSGVDSIFVPFRFVSRSVCWSGKYDVKWNISGLSAGASNVLATTVASVNLPAKAALTAIARKSGVSETYFEQLDYNGPVWSEYAISSRMSGITAACYGEDKIHPIVRVKTSAVDGLLYTLDSEIELVSGRKIVNSGEIQTHQGWGRRYLCELTAGNVKCISWSLKHCGCELTSGKVLFQSDPFEVVPDAVSGELFKKGDDFVVLVVSKRSAEREVTNSSVGDGKGVLFMDGFVFDGQNTSEMIREAQDLDSWSWLSVSGLESCPSRSGTSLLQSFTKMDEALEADTVIYAPSLGCITSEGGPDGFERRLAAMCGLLTHSEESSPRVILVVPPPYESLPGGRSDVNTSAEAVNARQVAEIVLRVADAYGVETVDLFTAFEIARKNSKKISSLTDCGELTPEGSELARNIIMRKL